MESDAAVHPGPPAGTEAADVAVTALYQAPAAGRAQPESGERLAVLVTGRAHTAGQDGNIAQRRRNGGPRG
jgi:hypothetical protein